MADHNVSLREHNQQQVTYFEARTKHTMLPELTPYNKRQADKLLALMEIKPGERVLEVGCGMGRHAFYLAKKGIKVEGLDVTPGLLDQFRAFNANGYDIPLYCGDVVAFADQLAGKYDAVIGFFVLHHLYDIHEAFLAISKMLKPGGRVGFVEPNPYNPLYYVQIGLTPGMSWQSEKGIAKMRRNVIFDAMRAAGLSSFRQEFSGFFPRFVTNRQLGLSLEAFFETLTFLRPIRPFQFFGSQR